MILGGVPPSGGRTLPTEYKAATDAAALAALSLIENTMAAQGAAALCVNADIERATALWRTVGLDVSRMIGRRGCAAVMSRALITARRDHPWIPEPVGEASFDESLGRFAAASAKQQADECRRGNCALEAAFRGLLVSLVGPALTTQLLRSAWSGRNDEPELVR